MDYEIIPVQVGKGQQLAAVRRKQPQEGNSQGDRNLMDNDMAEILAIADNEQELHDKVKNLSRKKLFGIF